MQGVGHIYPLVPSYGPNWDHKVTDFVFVGYISFNIAFMQCLSPRFIISFSQTCIHVFSNHGALV